MRFRGSDQMAALLLKLKYGAILSLILLFWPVLVWGQCIATVATLSSMCIHVKGTIASVTDGSTPSDCTVGGGTSANACMYNGTAWGFVANTLVIVPNGTTGYGLSYSSSTTLLPNPNPLFSIDFPSGSGGDRCAAIHTCVVTTANSVNGVCDARGELHNSPFYCNSNPLPIQTDNLGGGKLYLPAGQIQVPTCAQFLQNSFDIEGTGGGDGVTGGTQFIAGSSLTATSSSGGTYCPFVVNFGQTPAQAGLSGLNGPYSSHMHDFAINGNAVPGIGCLGIFSGQDNTTIDRINFDKCDFAIGGGNNATGDGPSLKSVYEVRSSPAACADNDPGATGTNGAGTGGTPGIAGSWWITPTGVSEVPSGILVMNKPTGAVAAGGGNGVGVFPGREGLIGKDTSCSGYTGTGKACLTTARGNNHTTNIDNDYYIGAVSDFVGGMTVTGGGGGLNGSNITPVLFTGTNDFPQDNFTSTCPGNTSGTISTATCNKNALAYISNCSGTNVPFNNKVVTIYSSSTGSFTGWVNALFTGPLSGTCNVAYANSVDPNTFVGTPFTAADQIAMNTGVSFSGGACTGAPANTQSNIGQTCADSAAANTGTFIVYSTVVNLNPQDSLRPYSQWTFTNTSCTETSNSEYPAHDLNISGVNFTLDGASHFESSKFEPIAIGMQGPTENIEIDDFTPVSNDGWSQGHNSTSTPCTAITGRANGGVCNAPTPGHSSAVRIYNRFSVRSIRISRLDASTSVGGANEPLNVIQDDVNNNTILQTSCPIVDYYDIDEAGGVTTSCPASSINNGISVNNGVITMRVGGSSVFSVSAAGQLSKDGTNPAIGITPLTSDNSTNLATTAYVQNQGYETTSAAQTAFSGIGNCANGVVTGLNANAPPNCAPVFSEVYANASGTGSISITPFTMVTSPSTPTFTLYRISFYAFQVAAGIGCMSNTSVAANLTFQDLLASAPTTLTLTNFLIIAGGTANAPMVPQVSGAYSSYVFRAKATTNVQYSTVVSPPSCTTSPTYLVIPLLEQLL